MNASVSKIMTVGIAGGLGLAAFGIGASATGVGTSDRSTPVVVASPSPLSHPKVITPGFVTGNNPDGMVQGTGTRNGSHGMTQGPSTGNGPEHSGMQGIHSSPAMPQANRRVTVPASGPVQGAMDTHRGFHANPAAGAGGMGAQMGRRR